MKEKRQPYRLPVQSNQRLRIKTSPDDGAADYRCRAVIVRPGPRRPAAVRLALLRYLCRGDRRVDFEPLPGAVIGITGVVVIALCSQWLLFSPDQMAAPGFKMAGASFKWAVSGFGNSTVWLIFGAFMFAAGYDKTQFGRRLALILVKYLGRRSLTLGYAITFADLLLAPFTPSNTARSGDYLPDYR